MCLGYSYSTGLSETEAAVGDQLISRNRESVSIFVTKFPSNAKHKAKIFYIDLMFALSTSLPLAPCVTVILPPPIAVHRLHLIDVDRMYTHRNSPRPAPVINNRLDKII